MATTATAAAWHRHGMARHPHPTRLRRERHKWALTLRELGELIGGSESLVSKYESSDCSPSLEVMLALEIILGMPSRDLFPAMYHAAYRAVILRAEALLESVGGKQDKISLRKRELLSDLITRSQQVYDEFP